MAGWERARGLGLAMAGGGGVVTVLASAAVVAAFEPLTGRSSASAAELLETVAVAASRVGALGGGGPGAPGTTLAGVLLTEQAGRAYWLAFNVGDSRVYLLRDGAMEQISVDHSRRQELLDAGVDPERTTAARNVITRAIGGGRPGMPVVDQWLRPAARGDRVLICSDGLTTELTDVLIQATLRSNADPQDAARALVGAALEAGGRDNVTAVVVDASRVGSTAGATGDDEDTFDDGPQAALDEDTEQLGPFIVWREEE